MVEAYPHLAMCLPAFTAGKHCHTLCRVYLVEEVQRFSMDKAEYLNRLKGIEELKDIKKMVREYNLRKPANKRKAELDEPNEPPHPVMKVFRNLDILRGMVRGWFELEYKKILKRSILGN
jgi:hypothetical protein